MPSKMMYFNDVIYAKLIEEVNASALVSRLLREHWDSAILGSNDIAKLTDMEVSLLAQAKEIQAKKNAILGQAEAQEQLKGKREEAEMKQWEEESEMYMERAKRRKAFDAWLKENPKQVGKLTLEEWMIKHG